jgi:hypothetical protein
MVKLLDVRVKCERVDRSVTASLKTRGAHRGGNRLHIGGCLAYQAPIRGALVRAAKRRYALRCAYVLHVANAATAIIGKASSRPIPQCPACAMTMA